MNPLFLELKSFTCHVVRIPLRLKVSHHLAHRAIAENVLLTVHSADNLEGWGECCPREYVTGETISSVQHSLAADMIPGFLHRQFNSFADVVQALTEAANHLNRNQQAAFCALELAVLDLAGKHFQCPVTDAIGGAALSTLRYSGVLAADDTSSVADQASHLQQFGFDSIKVKVTRNIEFNHTTLRTVRQIFGKDVSVRLDANGAWTAIEAVKHLTELKQYDIAGVEQPVPGDDFKGMAEVTAAAITAVVADESLCSMADAERLIQQKGCDIFNIRISKCGGLINSLRIAQIAYNAGLRCQLGAQVGETGFLSAAGRHFASAVPGLVWLEGSYDSYLLEQQITTPDITLKPGGRADAITAPGLGVVPVRKALETTSFSEQEYV